MVWDNTATRLLLLNFLFYENKNTWIRHIMTQHKKKITLTRNYKNIFFVLLAKANVWGETASPQVFSGAFTYSEKRLGEKESKHVMDSH